MVTVTVGVTVTLMVGVAVGGDCLAVAVEDEVVAVGEGDLPGTDAAAGHHTLMR